MATLIGVSDTFITSLLSKPVVRKRFRAVRDAADMLRRVRGTSGCCGHGADGQLASRAVSGVRNMFMNMSASDAADLKRILGLPSTVKFLVSTGAGSSRRERRI